MLATFRGRLERGLTRAAKAVGGKLRTQMLWDRDVGWGEPLRLEQTGHFSPERKPRSFTEDPANGDFWPVPVDDLLPEINAALEHLATAARSELAVLS